MSESSSPIPTGYFQYETKCRRCLSLNSWAGLSYAPSNKTEKYTSFLGQMRDKIDHPRQDWCDHCEQGTVQDVVSYESFTEE